MARQFQETVIVLKSNTDSSHNFLSNYPGKKCTETQSQRLAFCKSDLKGRGFVVFLCIISPLIGAVDCGVWNPFLLPTVESKLIEYGILANFLKGMNWYFFFFFLCFLKGPNSIFLKHNYQLISLIVPRNIKNL